MPEAEAGLAGLALRFPRGGFVLNVGADVIEVERVAKVCQRRKERFLKRVFTEEERDYCFGKSDPFPHLAARFAAKEAVSKAFSTGIGKWFGWKSCGIYHDPGMQPLVRLDEQGKTLLRALDATDVRITLSHTKTVALAVALLVKEQP